MLPISTLREYKDKVIKQLSVKNIRNAKEMVEETLHVDDLRKETQKKLDDLKAEANLLAKEIGTFFKEGKEAQATKLKEKTAELKVLEKTLSDKLSGAEKQLTELLYKIPNLPHETVPVGKTAEENEIMHQEGEIPSLYSGAKPHWDLCTQYDLLSFELGNKITGAGFPVYKGKGAALQRGLINFFLDHAIQKGYVEIQPPLLINEASGIGTGQLPDKDGQMYHVTQDDLYLIPTAEVPVTNLYRDMIVKEEELPIKHCAYSACFRREAGSYGKDVRGLNRLHQFDKVEIVVIERPEDSYTRLEEMKAYVSSLLQELNLPFRILRLCGGDLSFTSALTYDFEVFSAAQEKWLEVSSVSNFESYQSLRMKLRYKNKEGKTQAPHTLNGSALALPRIVAALLENNQTPEGILMPKALQKYLPFTIIH